MSDGSDCRQNRLPVAVQFPDAAVGTYIYTVDEYSNIGRTCMLDDLVLQLLENSFFKFVRMNPSALFADLVIFPTWCFQFRSFVGLCVTPRYLASATVP